MLWGTPCGALLQGGKQRAAPDPSQKILGVESRLLLSAVWEPSAKTKPQAGLGKLSLRGALRSLWLFPVLGREGGRRKSLGGGKPQGIHHAALSRAASPWPGLQGSHRDRTGHLGRPCLPKRGSQRGTLQPWRLDNQESFCSWPSPRAGARGVFKAT